MPFLEAENHKDLNLCAVSRMKAEKMSGEWRKGGREIENYIETTAARWKNLRIQIN